VKRAAAGDDLPLEWPVRVAILLPCRDIGGGDVVDQIQEPAQLDGL
jgi:hypothetical protein